MPLVQSAQGQAGMADPAEDLQKGRSASRLRTKTEPAEVPRQWRLQSAGGGQCLNVLIRKGAVLIQGGSADSGDPADIADPFDQAVKLQFDRR